MKYQNTKMLQLSLNLLKLYGFHPDQTRKIHFLINVFTVLSALLILLPMIMEVILNWEGLVTLKKIYFFPACLMFLVKAMVMWHSKPTLQRLLESISKLWQTDKFDKQTQEQCDKIFQNVYKVMVAFIIITQTNCLITLGASLLSNPRIVLYRGYDFCYYDENTLCWITVIIVQTIWMLFHAIPMLLSFDYLFLSACTYIYVGALLLRAALQQLQLTPITSDMEKITTQNLKLIVDQHNIMFWCVRELNKYSAPVLAVQFGSSLGSLIFCLYVLTADGMPPESSEMKYFLFYLMFTMQLFIFSFASTLFYEKLHSLVDDFYDLPWYSANQQQLRRDLAFIILRIQTMPSLKLAKTINLDLPLLLSVLQTSFSVYTLLSSFA